MYDLDNWDIHYDNMMPQEQSNQLKDMLFEIKRIKQRNTGKHYMEKRTSVIDKAEATRQLDRNSPRISDYLYTIKTPWSSGYGQANDAYDQHQIHTYQQRIAQLPNTNAQLCQMEISSKHGPTGQDDL
jgi:hypothetical protein